MEIKNIFDYIKILNKKEKITVRNWDLFLKNFNSFIINRFYSNDKFTIYFSELMNMKTEYLTKKMIFDFYYYGLPKINHFIKYTKKEAENDKNILYIQKYFDISIDEAKEYLKIIDKKELDKIISIYENIGINKKDKRRS